MKRTNTRPGPRMSDEAVQTKTGKNWKQWFAIIDTAGGMKLTHQEIVKLLLDDRDKRTPSLLEQAHELGVMTAVMPEFAPCTGRVQHDLYHAGQIAVLKRALGLPAIAS